MTATTRRQVALLVAAAVATGCGGQGAPPAGGPAQPSPTPVAAADLGLTAEVRQYRRDVALDRLEVTVTNGGDRPVLLATVALDSPGLSASGVTTDARLEPGRRVDLVTAFGSATCPAPGAPEGSAGDATVRLTVGVDGAPPVPVVLTLAAPVPVLDLVHARLCARQERERAYTLGWTGQWQRADDATGPALRGALRLRRGDAVGAVLLTGRASNIVATVEVPGAPTGLDADAGERDVPVLLRVQRCDGHALTGSRTWYVTVFVEVAGGEAQAADTLPDAAGIAALDALRADSCPDPETAG